jgi:hypothetical protein
VAGPTEVQVEHQGGLEPDAVRELAAELVAATELALKFPA